MEQWDQKLASVLEFQRRFKFDELVDLALTATELRIAFDPMWQVGMNRASKVNFYRQETFKLHGIHPYVGCTDMPLTSALTLDQIAENSLIDADVWDGFSQAVSEVIRDNHAVSDVARDWASAVVGGYYQRPREKGGPHPLKHSARDTMLVAFLYKLDCCDIPITENEATLSNH